MVNRDTNLLNAFETTLAAEMSSVASSCTLTSATGLVQTFYMVIEPEDNAQREYMFVSVLAGVVCTVPERYLAGSASPSGLTHPVGSVVRHIAMSQHFEDLNDRADDLQAQITAGADHGGLSGLADDDHTQYLNVSRHDSDNHSGLAAGDLPTHTHEGGSQAGKLDHGLALNGLTDDDHTQYLDASRHDTDHALVGGVNAQPLAMISVGLDGSSHDIPNLTRTQLLFDTVRWEVDPLGLLVLDANGGVELSETCVVMAFARIQWEFHATGYRRVFLGTINQPGGENEIATHFHDDNSGSDGAFNISGVSNINVDRSVEIDVQQNSGGLLRCELFQCSLTVIVLKRGVAV